MTPMAGWMFDNLSLLLKPWSAKGLTESAKLLDVYEIAKITRHSDKVSNVL